MSEVLLDLLHKDSDDMCFLSKKKNQMPLSLAYTVIVDTCRLQAKGNTQRGGNSHIAFEELQSLRFWEVHPQDQMDGSIWRGMRVLYMLEQHVPRWVLGNATPFLVQRDRWTSVNSGTVRKRWNLHTETKTWFTSNETFFGFASLPRVLPFQNQSLKTDFPRFCK